MGEDKMELIRARRGWKLLGALLVAVGLVAFAAGCGGGDDSGSGSTADTRSETETGSGGSALVEEAADFVAEKEQAPTSVGDFEPLSKAPAKGVTFVGLGVGTAGGLQYNEGQKAASAALGWKFQYLEGGSTPQSVTTAWNQLLRIKPDAIGSIGIPSELFASQLKQLTGEGVLHTADGLPEKANGEDILANVGSEPTYLNRGEWMAKWVIADSEGEGNALYITAAEYPILEFSETSFEETMASCPDCTSKVLSVPAAAIGKDLPPQVVSEIQRDPDIDYIVGGFGDLTTGVPEALQAAGLSDKVQIVTANPTTRNLEGIEEGTESAAVGEGGELAGWLMIDSVARKLDGQELPLENYASVPLRLITAKNVGDIKTDATSLEIVPGYQEQFKKLWGLED
jgi:ribose transport system substrate-binding protein